MVLIHYKSSIPQNIIKAYVMKKLLFILASILPFYIHANKKEKQAQKLFNTILLKNSRYAIKYRLSKSSANIRDKRGNTILHYASLRTNPKIMRSLIKKAKKVVDTPNDDGNTPLHFAAQAGDVEQVNLLIKYGANWDVLNEKKQKPIDLAIEKLKESSYWKSYCVICKGIAPFESHTQTKCGHIFCKGCLAAWHDTQLNLDGHGTCPVCRTKLTTNPHAIPRSFQELDTEIIAAIDTYMHTRESAIDENDYISMVVNLNMRIEELRSIYISQNTSFAPFYLPNVPLRSRSQNTADALQQTEPRRTQQHNVPENELESPSSRARRLIYEQLDRAEEVTGPLPHIRSRLSEHEDRQLSAHTARRIQDQSPLHLLHDLQ